MKKRILSIVLTLALCLSLLPTAVLAAEGTEVTSITVKTASDKEYSDITLPGIREDVAQLQLYAVDRAGQPLESSAVTWRLKNSNGRDFEGSGVSVNDQGVVTVNYHASVGTVHVWAFVTTENGEVSDYFPITIKKVRAVKEIVFYKTSVETGNEVNADTINIVDDTFSPTVYCAVVNDQYGAPLSLAKVTWSEPEKNPADNAFSYTSNNGSLTVSPAEGSTAQNGTAVFTAT